MAQHQFTEYTPENMGKTGPSGRRGSYGTAAKTAKQGSEASAGVGASTVPGEPDSDSDANSFSRIQIKPVNDEDDTSVMITFNQSVSWFIVSLTFVASISGFMFGYDTGYISSALVSIGTDLDNRELTYGNKELITAATSLGALISSVVAGTCADIWGRKPCIMFSNVLFVIGAALQVSAHTFWQMAIGRLIMGFGVGIGSLISPLFIGEIAPKMIRGRLVVINSLCLTGGQLIAYGCGAGLDKVHNGWRILVGLSLIPTCIQFVCFCFLPDTPRFYVMKGRLDKAAEVLAKSYNSAPQELIQQKIIELSSLNRTIPGKTVAVRVLNTIKELHTEPSNFRALVLACAMQGIQQFCGWNSLLYFSGTIFETVGFKNSAAVSIVVAGTNFVFTLVAFFAIDRIGRRVILLIGLPGMCLSLVVCAIAFHFMDVRFEGGGSAVIKDSGFTAWGIVIILSIICYAAFYALGIGTVPWQQSELFPQAVRGVGTSYSTATNWAGSLVIASTFLTMLQNITPTGTFALFAALSLVSFLFIYFCYPELSGLELEEVQMILKDGFNIKASQTLAKKRKQQMADQRNAAHDNELQGYNKAKPSDELMEG
ncbi:LAME_0F06282g1_1 [Lachancea meyersii CBS 8951]|uniref:LAME_0F06282g1_1 n=1 Tax=Lachancea meyersii CBS 8951 TaxID=1266667 RepID=A0A1G4JTB6_9SACH|nr:LAME_0F06282g1_1 [Lachancea meyersii CBS 8951]